MANQGFLARAIAGVANPSNLNNRYTAALAGSGLPGNSLEGEYEKRLRGFNPQESLNTYATGAWDTIQNGVGGVKDQLRDLKGSAVGAGRLDTGFFDEDQGTVINRGLQSFGSAVAGQAMNATAMGQRNTEDLGALGETRNTRYLDLLAGGLDRQQADENARRQRSAGRGGGIGSVIGGIGGFLVGGPAGAVAGASAGGAIGRGIGG